MFVSETVKDSTTFAIAMTLVAIIISHNTRGDCANTEKMVPNSIKPNKDRHFLLLWSINQRNKPRFVQQVLIINVFITTNSFSTHTNTTNYKQVYSSEPYSGVSYRPTHSVTGASFRRNIGESAHIETPVHLCHYYQISRPSLIQPPKA